MSRCCGAISPKVTAGLAATPVTTSRTRIMREPSVTVGGQQGSRRLGPLMAAHGDALLVTGTVATEAPAHPPRRLAAGTLPLVNVRNQGT